MLQVWQGSGAGGGQVTPHSGLRSRERAKHCQGQGPLKWWQGAGAMKRRRRHIAWYTAWHCPAVGWTSSGVACAADGVQHASPQAGACSKNRLFKKQGLKTGGRGPHPLECAPGSCI
jgi:hypothetical protein